MAKNNLFHGDSHQTLFALTIYELLMSRQWITNEDVMVKHTGKPLSCNISNCNHYGELKKAFRNVRKAIIQKMGETSIEESGNNRDKKYKYVGNNDNPLSEMRKARVINKLNEYWQFCQASAGFFPTVWLDYFFQDTKDLLAINQKKYEGEEIIGSSMERKLKNIELLPRLYEAIVNKQVLNLSYKPYGGEEITLTVHPHYLKEYNGRWHLFGHTENAEPTFGYDIPLDRIQGDLKVLSNIPFKKAPQNFYKNYFKDIVGVSHVKDAQATDIIIRAHNYPMFKLAETKPIHPSQQTTTTFGEYKDGSYGEFTVHLKINNEFIGRILQMGEGLEIISPIEIREAFKKRIKALANLYE